MSKKLAISIPNYERIKELERLLLEVIGQIEKERLEEEVKICISDDYSKKNPSELISQIKFQHQNIDIIFSRNEQNVGMDRNFVHSVLMADSEYCWIIGNDDLPTDNALKYIVEYLNNHIEVDFMVTPFDAYDDHDNYKFSINPLTICKDEIFNCNIESEKNRLFMSVKHNCGIFGFLSNVIFRRNIWIDNNREFNDKMNTLFIQIYINVNALFKGARYHYCNTKIIRNYSEDTVNDSIERMSKILFGLDGVVEYFFDGEIKQHMKEVITDGCINGWIWSLPDESDIKKKLYLIQSPKNELYRRLYISENQIYDRLKNEKIYLYGAGVFGQKSFELLTRNNIEISGVADGSKEKKGVKWNDYTILSIEELREEYRKSHCYVIVCSHEYIVEMVKILEKNNIDKIAIVC